jgi:hypothetical protein
MAVVVVDAVDLAEDQALEVQVGVAQVVQDLEQEAMELLI